MGAFRVDCLVSQIVDRSRFAEVAGLLVDSCSEYTWIPETTLESIGVAREKKDLQFVMANGQIVTRSVGFAILRVEPHFTIDEVVFAHEGDLLILGARTLEGLCLTVDPREKKLVASGPLPAASVSSRCDNLHAPGPFRPFTDKGSSDDVDRSE
jgi:predicted aspartyl protease